jgi:hypothetical protein
MKERYIPSPDSEVSQPHGGPHGSAGSWQSQALAPSFWHMARYLTSHHPFRENPKKQFGPNDVEIPGSSTMVSLNGGV